MGRSFAERARTLVEQTAHRLTGVNVLDRLAEQWREGQDVDLVDSFLRRQRERVRQDKLLQGAGGNALHGRAGEYTVGRGGAYRRDAVIAERFDRLHQCTGGINLVID